MTITGQIGYKRLPQITYKKQDGGATVHERFDLFLVERIADRVRVLVVAMVTHPGLLYSQARSGRRRARVRTSLAMKLELDVSRTHQLQQLMLTDP
jgi:hypothetical protein